MPQSRASNEMTIDRDRYLIVDLEATCSSDGSVPRQRMEIIEIGAVMVNAQTLIVESEFQSFVRPILHPQLTDFCQQLTSIAQLDVDNAPLFPKALRQFQDWVYPFGDYLFCSWGDYDKNQFKQDCALHKVGYPFPSGHLNLKKAFAATLQLKKKLGLAQALDLLKLPLEGTHHRGIDDARNMARIVQKVMG